MTSSFSIQTSAVGDNTDIPWYADERIGKSPSGRRRHLQPSPWSNCFSSYRYATNSFVGDLLGKSKITMLHKTHKENFSKSLAPFHGEAFLVKDSQNPFLLTRNISDRLLQDNDEDNFYHAIRTNYSSALKKKLKSHQINPRLPRNMDNRNPNTSKSLLATFYKRQLHVKEATDLTKLSDHLCFEDGDDKVYNYSLRSSTSLSSSVHPLLRPSLLHFRKRRPAVLSKGRNCHRRGSTTSCSTLSSFDTFSSFTHNKSEESSPSGESRKPSSVLGSSLKILMQTSHHQKVAPTSVSSAKQNSVDTVFDTIILNIKETFDDLAIAETGATHGNMKEPSEKKIKRETTKESAKNIDKAANDYNKSETSMDFCLLEKPKTKRRGQKRFDQDDTPLSIFQPSVSSTQAESSSGLLFAFDPSVPV